MHQRILFTTLVAAGLAMPLRATASQDTRAWIAAENLSHVIVPQAGGFAVDPARSGITIESVRARIDIVEQVATTTLDIALFNPDGRMAEAVLVLPVPDGAAVSAFDFDGAAAEPTARLLPAEEARRTYDEIVRRIKDPALLEFAGYGSVRSSVFPVPAGGKQRVRLTYEHVLERDGARVDYVLPRSEALAVTVPWQLHVDVRSKTPISTLYSPSHALHTQRQLPNHMQACLASGANTGPDGTREPGAFRLSYLLDNRGVTASLLSCPDAEEDGGYFLLLAGLPAANPEAPALRREVTLVIDRSGSMGGGKLEQAKNAALQVLEGLRDGEALQVIDYSDDVRSLAPRPVVKNPETMAQARAYVASLVSNGGTNMQGALQDALRQPATPETLPLILFLTDGLPTVGETCEQGIAATAERDNAAQRRIFTFGVGHDVNAPLLDRLAERTRATSTYVLPGEDVEVAVGQVFRRLEGPVLADLELEVRDAEGAVTTRAVFDVLPETLPDLFEGDQLVLLGRYTEAQPLEFRLSGNFRGRQRSFAFRFDMENATTRNTFVSRLWAARKIAVLTDQVRQAGAAAGVDLATNRGLFDDPRFRELGDEILRLSTRFGILTEFTSFLATEGTELDDWNSLEAATVTKLDERAVQQRTGQAAVNSARNYGERLNQSVLNTSNYMWNAVGERVQVANVQQIADRAFFQRGNRWIDARAIGSAAGLEPDRVVTFGSAEHRALTERFVREGRQGLLALRGEILMDVDGERVLVKNDTE